MSEPTINTAADLIEQSSDFFANFLGTEKSENFPARIPQTATAPIDAEEADLKAAATDLMAQIEVHYNFAYELIKLSTLRENFLGDDASFRVLIFNHINPKLEKRGLPLYVLDPVPVKLVRHKSELDPVFVLACNVIINPSDSRSFAARMKDLEPLGVTSKTWTAWLNEPKKFEYARKLLDEKFDKEVDVQADMALARNVMAGDLQSIKFYKELTGKFKPANENATNVAAILMAMMEILARHVKPEVIDAVASELESSPVGELLSGRTVIG